jgi:hypothetical protein
MGRSDTPTSAKTIGCHLEKCSVKGVESPKEAKPKVEIIILSLVLFRHWPNPDVCANQFEP